MSISITGIASVDRDVVVDECLQPAESNDNPVQIIQFNLIFIFVIYEIVPILFNYISGDFQKKRLKFNISHKIYFAFEFHFWVFCDESDLKYI